MEALQCSPGLPWVRGQVEKERALAQQSSQLPGLWSHTAVHWQSREEEQGCPAERSLNVDISVEKLGCGHGPGEAQPSRDSFAVLHRPAGLTGAEVRDVHKGMCASPSKDAMDMLPTPGSHMPG